MRTTSLPYIVYADSDKALAVSASLFDILIWPETAQFEPAESDAGIPKDHTSVVASSDEDPYIMGHVYEDDEDMVFTP